MLEEQELHVMVKLAAVVEDVLVLVQVVMDIPILDMVFLDITDTLLVEAVEAGPIILVERVETEQTVLF
jgi:hypothetical protein